MRGDIGMGIRERGVVGEGMAGSRAMGSGGGSVFVLPFQRGRLLRDEAGRVLAALVVRGVDGGRRESEEELRRGCWAYGLRGIALGGVPPCWK